MRTGNALSLCVAVVIAIPIDIGAVASSNTISAITTISGIDQPILDSEVGLGDIGVNQKDSPEQQTEEGGLVSAVPEGHVNSEPPNWVVSSLDVDTRTAYRWSEEDLIAESGHGTYIFREDRADFQVKSNDGSDKVLFSFFTIESDGGLASRGPARILQAGSSASIEYDVSTGNGLWGHIVTSFDFHRTGPPKISVQAKSICGGSCEARHPRIVWVVGTPYEDVSMGPESPYYLYADQALRGKETSVLAGEMGDTGAWRPRIRLDWTGETAEARTGEYSSGQNAIFIRFPYDKWEIDPFVVVEGVDVGALGTSTQRKILSANGWTWFFYIQDSKITYRLGRLVMDDYQPMVWERPQTPFPDSTATSFDVAQDGNVLALAWNEGSNLKLRVGFIVNNHIFWRDNTMIFSEIAQIRSPPSVAIGDNRYVWVATGFGGDDHKLAYYACPDYYSESCGGGSFATAEEPFPSLLPLSEGRVMLVYVTLDDSCIHWRLFDPHRGWWDAGWSDEGSDCTYPVDYAQGGDAFSAVARIAFDGALQEESVFAHVLYREPSGKVRYLVIRFPFSQWTGQGLPGEAICEQECRYPSISMDTSGFLHASWIHYGGEGSTVFYARSKHSNSWLEAFSGLDYPPWMDPKELYHSGDPYFISSLTANSQPMETLNVAWLIGPSQGPFDIQFALLPLPWSAANVAPGPWGREGIFPDSPFVAERNEFVSLGTGKLIVHETDMSVEAIGPALEITRIYVQPDEFDLFSPYGHDRYLPAPMGLGWRLNLPWIDKYYGSQMLYWKDGQKYLINWIQQPGTGGLGEVVAVFENHNGTHFRLEAIRSPMPHFNYYLLTEPSGVQYSFYNWGLLEQVIDPFGNKLKLSYNGYHLASIGEYYNAPTGEIFRRGFTFDYYADSHQVHTITDSDGRMTTYQYEMGEHGWILASVTDPEGRVVHYSHDLFDDYLLTEIYHIAGGHSLYFYESYYLGTELKSFAVVGQIALKSADFSEPVRYTWYDFEIVSGKVTFVNVTVEDEAGLRQGYTHYIFDTQTGSLETRVFDTKGTDSAGAIIKRSVSWYSRDGSMNYQETFVGDSTQPYFATESVSDEWGNQIYASDSSGHEKFMTYAHTKEQNAFKSPGRFDKTSSGLTFRDDFASWNLDWGGWDYDRGPEFNPPVLDSETFFSRPPSVTIEDDYGWSDWPGNGPSLKKQFDNLLQNVHIEFRVKFGDQSGAHRIEIDKGMAHQVVLDFADNGEIKYWFIHAGGWNKESFNPPLYYEQGVWYRVGISIHEKLMTPTRFLWDLWLDGVLVVQDADTADRALEPNADSIAFRVAEHSKMWINGMNIYAVDYFRSPPKPIVTVTGLEPGKSVRLVSLSGALLRQARVPVGSTSVIVDTSPIFPDVRLEVLDVDFSLESQSPFVGVWGGDVFAYEAPWSLGGLKRTTNGFTHAITYSGTILDDDLPVGATLDGEELVPPWTGDWPWMDGDGLDHPMPMSREKIHSAKYDYWLGYHLYKSNVPIDPKLYIVQYAYIEAGQSPDELLLQYCVGPGGPDPCGWTARAYWGEDYINLGGKVYMGTLPGRRDQWLMLVIDTLDIDPSFNPVWGVAFDHWGGNVSWDYSGFAPISVDYGNPNEITITGALEDICSAKLLDEQGSVIATGWPSNGHIKLELYDSASPIRAFPIRGQFKLRSCGLEEAYISPMFENLWGGDVFEYSDSGFYANDALITDAAVIHNRLVGTLEFQTGRGATPVIPQKTFYEYDSRGFLLETRRSHEGGWISTSQAPDQYGNVASATDPLGHVTTYQYACFDQSTYLWRETQTLEGGTQVVTQYDWNCNRGLLEGVTDPRGYPTPDPNDFKTSYAYDDVGRLVQIVFPAVGSQTASVNYEYRDAEYPRKMIYTDAEGHRTLTEYDGLGRKTSVKRCFDSAPPICDIAGSFYSEAKWSYNWQDLVVGEISPEGVSKGYEYDLLGRIVRTINDDLTSVAITYDDYGSFEERNVTDERGDKRGYLYDLGGVMIAVREYDGEIYETRYSYDKAGNLLTVTTPVDSNGERQITTHQYDDLNRLTATTYPDQYSTTVTLQYDDDGNVVSRADGLGTTVFQYDRLDRLTEEDFGDLVRTYYYDLNSNIETSISGGTTLGATTSYLHDSRNRMTQQIVQVPFDVDSYPNPICGNVRHQDYPVRVFNFIWTKNNDLAQITYPDGYQVTYLYDEFNRVVRMPGILENLDAGPPGPGVVYNKDDQIKQLYFSKPLQPPGMPSWSSEFNYDERGRLWTATHLKGGNQQLVLSYYYYDDGNVQFHGNGQTSEWYEYDHRERLTDATGSWGGTTEIKYTYDNLGNRLSMQKLGTPPSVTSYDYGKYNQLDYDYEGGSTTGYSYDLNGNLVTKTHMSQHYDYDYDEANQLVSVRTPSGQTQCHGYDAEGQMVRLERTTGMRIRKLWIGSLLMAEEDINSPNAMDYVYLGGKLIARVVQPAGDAYFYMQDGLGNTRMVVQKASGAIVFRASYQPFGVEVPGTGQEATKYIQRQWDDNIGLYYLLNRFYDPRIGRFVGRDSGLGSLHFPQTSNRYVYAANNPTGYTDPDGNWLFLAFLFIGAFVSAPLWLTSSVGSPEFWGGISMWLSFVPGPGFVIGAWNAVQDCSSGDALGCGMDIAFLSLDIYVAARAWRSIRTSTVAGADDIIDSTRAGRAVENPSGEAMTGRPGELSPADIRDFRPDVASRPRPLFGGKQTGIQWDMPSGFRVQGHPAHLPPLRGEPFAHYKIYEPALRGGRVHWVPIRTLKAGVDQVPWWLW